MELEKLIVSLLFNNKDFIKGVDKAKSSTNSLSSTLSKVGGSALKVGGLMSVGLTTPITAFGMASINAASDLNETVSKVGVVFGEQSDEVLKFGENAAQALGMSKNEALSAAGTYGNLFVSMGLTEQASADMSMGLVGLASDLGSFNNMASTDVLDKLRAGLTGETEPLKALGVNLNAAMVEAKALDMGLMTVGGTLDAAAKAQATYALVLDQTKTAQGDFARTSDGLANSTKIAKAEFENITAQIGTSLLPIATDLMKSLIPILEWFNALDPSVKQNIVVIGGLIAAIGPAISIIGTLSATVGTLIGLFGAGGGLAGVGTFLSGTVLPGIGLAVGAVGLPVIALGAGIAALIAVILIFGEDAQNTLNMVKGIFDGTMMVIGWWLKDTFIATWNNVSNAIAGVVGWVQTLASSFNSLSVPAIFQPGSPTPFENGLRGINSAMSALNKTTLPTFNSQLNVQTKSPIADSIPSKTRNNNDDKPANSQQSFDFDYPRFGREVVNAMIKAGVGA
jgi:hypothetical protein